MKRDTAQAAAEFTAEMTGERVALHLGPGPHPDGSPQSIHAGGAKRPTPKGPRNARPRVPVAAKAPAKPGATKKVARPTSPPKAAPPTAEPAAGDDHPAVLAFVRQYANAGREHTMAITKAGLPTKPLRGSEEHVRLPQDFVDAQIVIHNHPDSSGFSPGDMEQAVKYNIQDLRVTSPEYSYQLKAPKGGYPDRWGVAKLKMRYQQHFEQALPKHLESDRSIRQQMQDITHEVMQRVAADFGLEYTRKPRPKSGTAGP